MSNLEKGAMPLFTELKKLIESSRQHVALFVNEELTMLYWNVGKLIHQHLLTNGRADYGKEILPTLSAELIHDYGKGFSTRNLSKMMKFYELYQDDNILPTLSAKLSWSHFVELLGIEDDLKRDFFTQLCMYNKWGVRQLRDEIDSMLYERTAIASKPEMIIKQQLQHLGENKEISPELVLKTRIF